MADSFVVEHVPHEGGGSFAPMPAGTQHVVCVDGIYLGEKVDSYQGGPPKVVKKYAYVFQSAEVNPDTGKRYEISAEFTISMNEKAALRKFLSAWRGKTYSDDELRAFDIAGPVGANGLASVEHKLSGAGRTYGKLLGIAPLMKGLGRIVPDAYERAPYWETRKQEYAAGVAQHRANHAPAAPPITVPMGAAGNGEWAPADEPVPF